MITSYECQSSALINIEWIIMLIPTARKPVAKTGNIHNFICKWALQLITRIHNRSPVWGSRPGLTSNWQWYQCQLILFTFDWLRSWLHWTIQEISRTYSIAGHWVLAEIRCCWKGIWYWPIRCPLQNKSNPITQFQLQFHGSWIRFASHFVSLQW